MMRPILASIFILIALPTGGKAQTEWSVQCYMRKDCSEVGTLMGKSKDLMGKISAWYDESSLPPPRIEKDANGAPILRVDPTGAICGETAHGCYQHFKSEWPHRMVISAERKTRGGEFDDDTGKTSPLVVDTDADVISRAEIIMVHELLHAIQHSGIGKDVFNAAPSKNMEKAIPTLDRREKGMLWVLEGQAVAVEEEWDAVNIKNAENAENKKGNSFLAGEPRIIWLDTPLISPGPPVQDPYRLGPFWRHLGAAHPKGLLEFLAEVLTPALGDGADGMIHVDNVLQQKTGAGLRDHFARFVASRLMSPDASEETQELEFSKGIEKVTYPLDRQAAKEIAYVIAPYAASAMMIEFSGKAEDPVFAPPAQSSGDIETVYLLTIQEKGGTAHPDLQMVADSAVLPQFDYTKALTNGDSIKKPLYLRLVNFPEALIGATEKKGTLQIITKPLNVSAPLCVMPERSTFVLVNHPPIGLGFSVEAGTLVPGPPTNPDAASQWANYMIYTAPKKAGRYAITLPAGDPSRRVKVGEITVSPDPCRTDLVWDGDESSRSRYVFPLPDEAEGRPTSKEFAGAEMVLRPGKAAPAQMPSIETPRPSIADFPTGLHRDLAIAGGYLPPEMEAELKNLSHEERVVAEAALAHYRAQMGFALGENIATFGSATRQFDMLDPNQAMDGIAEMIFRMMRLDRLPSNAEMQRQGGPQMVRRNGELCAHVAQSICTVVLMEDVKLTYSPDGVLERFEGPGEDGQSGRIDILHNPVPRIREDLFMLTLMNRRPWEE
jgi:hypothetical protein